MVICREDGKIMLVNSRTELLFNCRREELLDQHMRVLVPEWEVNSAMRAKREAADAITPAVGTSYELKGIRRDGTTFPVEITLNPITIDRELLITSALRDITERKRVEFERTKAEDKIRELNEYLGELNAHLEERVAERTEQLVRSNEELAQFAYIASHDLREPLRTVSLYTQLLARRYGHDLQNEAHTFIRYILENAQRMELLVHDLLELCRVEGQAKHFSLTSCEAVVDQAMVNLQARIEESGAMVARDHLPEVHGDAVQLVSVFQNLIANSIQYRKLDESPKIHISASASGREWVFLVRDNGIGIAPEYIEKVFGIFKRLHGRENPGTGMGLAICRKIVMRHGGRIWLESERGAGTTSYFTLPIVTNR
jgi:PAS domain S-box-containing protein